MTLNLNKRKIRQPLVELRTMMKMYLCLASDFLSFFLHFMPRTIFNFFLISRMYSVEHFVVLLIVYSLLNNKKQVASCEQRVDLIILNL